MHLITKMPSKAAERAYMYYLILIILFVSKRSWFAHYWYFMNYWNFLQLFFLALRIHVIIFIFQQTSVFCVTEWNKYKYTTDIKQIYLTTAKEMLQWKVIVWTRGQRKVSTFNLGWWFTPTYDRTYEKK